MKDECLSCYGEGCKHCGGVETAELSESSLNDLLCNLVAEWEAEGYFLDNEHDTSYDRGIGQTYKKCASELRKIINR